MLARAITYKDQPAQVLAVRDIRERKQAEAEVHALNATLEQRVAQRTEELRAIMQAMSDGLVVVNRAQRVRYANPVAERLLGTTPVLGEELGWQRVRLPDGRDTGARTVRPLWPRNLHGRLRPAAGAHACRQ